ncbi:hypothetical protein GGF46_004248 [Coemansia sp. RSA 552]|nr:hypothetical protein GGF46_004248 [Coemansia sp. RSA 552]
MDEGRRPGAYNGTVEKSHTELAGISPRALFAEDRRWGMAGAVKLMSEREQWDVSERIGASRVAMASAAARRVRRRVHLRRLKRMLGLPIFDIDRAVAQAMARQLEPWHPARDGGEDDDEDDDGGVTRSSLLVGETGASTAVAETLRRPGDTAVSEPAGTAPGAQQLSVPEAAGDGGPSVVRVTAYANSFASRLLGRAALRDSLTAAGVRISPFHGRLLRPFIWRDTKPMGGAHDRQRRPAMAMLRVLRAIRGRQHRVFAAGTVEAPMAQPDRETIDYVHFQPRHVEQANALLCRTFWPGIDISEALQYPEFSIVALYRRRVVGCAFLTPDAYLTYIAVAAGWEGAGIARYMVYHLTQTVPTKDVTLHVAATNVAMLLYQQLGFKPETYTPGFYRAYLPETSRTCPNAFFMRLRREP